MPLALLLQETFAKFGKGAPRLNDWVVLVELEDLLLERVRSAFLVHWYGPILPLAGRTLRVAIHNIAELRARYQRVRAGMPADREGPNLAEPLATIAGTLGGILSMPLYGTALGVVIALKARSWVGKLIGALNTATLGALFPLVGVLAFPGAIGGALLAGIFAQGTVRPIFDLLGALAEMMEAMRGFVELLLGPRERIRNPILRLMLEIVDRLAALMAFALGLVALIFTRIGPLIVPLTDQTIALIKLIEAVVDLIGVIWDDFMTQLGNLFSGDHSLLAAIDPLLSVVERLGAAVLHQLKLMIEELSAAILGWAEWAAQRLTDFLDPAIKAIRRAFEEHPLVRTVMALVDQIKIALAALMPGPSTLMPKLKRAAAWVYSKGPQIPDLPDLPDTKTIAGRAGGKPILGVDLPTITALAAMIPTTFSFSPDAWRELERLRQPPPSVFRGELQRLAEEHEGLPLSAAMAALREQELPYRALIFAIVERVLPPAAGRYVGQLEDLFRTIDAEIYGFPNESPRPDLPVRDLPTSDRLLVSVDRLRVRVVSDDAAAVRAWSEQLRGALGRERYTTGG